MPEQLTFKKMFDDARKSPEYWLAGFEIELSCAVSEVMRQRKINIVRVAEKSGVHRDTVSKFLSGGTIRITNLFKIVYSLGYTIDPKLTKLEDKK